MPDQSTLGPGALTWSVAHREIEGAVRPIPGWPDSVPGTVATGPLSVVPSRRVRSRLMSPGVPE